MRPKAQKLQFGAGEGTQTPGLFLGKEALYQLSYTRINITYRLLRLSCYIAALLITFAAKLRN